MAKQTDNEELGDSWTQYDQVLNGGNDAPQPGGGELISPSPTPEEEPSAKNQSKKSRRKSVSRKVAAPVEKCDVRLTVLFPDAVIQQLKIVALAEKRSVSDIVRDAVAGYVNPVYNDRLKALFGE